MFSLEKNGRLRPANEKPDASLSSTIPKFLRTRQAKSESHFACCMTEVHHPEGPRVHERPRNLPYSRGRGCKRPFAPTEKRLRSGWQPRRGGQCRSHRKGYTNTQWVLWSESGREFGFVLA